MPPIRVYEGTLDEITTRYGKELAGLHLKVYVDNPPENGDERPFHETASTEEWIKALHAWAASHNPDSPPLSDEAVSRESIYEGRGE